MNIETSKVNSVKNTQNAQQNASSQNNNNSSIKFLDELDVLKVNQAVERCKELLYLFNKKNIQVIRIGLQNTENICSPSNENSEVVAGPYHETFRQLVETSIYYDTIVERIKKINLI